MVTWPAVVGLFAVGLVAGVVNVVAGGGSFLTLPVLIFFGLPAGVANGTNRVGILVQNVGASWSFGRHRLLDRRDLAWAALPAVAGAGLGTWAALVVSDEAFERILAVLMIGVALWALWGPRPQTAGEPTRVPVGRARILAGAGFFLVGIYGGFVQAGVGFFVLAVTSAVGLDLVRGNAVKVLTILCFTVLSLGLFALDGKVVWSLGAALAAGTVLGGLLGVRLTVLKGHRWVRGAVTVAILVFAVKLLVG